MLACRNFLPTKQNLVVRWEDFEKLTGGAREAVRGDAAKRLERRCVWETTCPMTGMPNAYTVSAVKGVEEQRRLDGGGGKWQGGGDAEENEGDVR